MKITSKISLVIYILLFWKIFDFLLPICQNKKQKIDYFLKKSSRWQEENNRLLFSLTGREDQGLKYFWERWAEQYIPRRTHKILDPIGPTPHKYLFVETEFSWCLKLCYYILTTYIHITKASSEFVQYEFLQEIIPGSIQKNIIILPSLPNM